MYPLLLSAKIIPFTVTNCALYCGKRNSLAPPGQVRDPGII